MFSNTSVHHPRNWGILISTTLRVPLEVDPSAIYTLAHYPNQPPVDMTLSGLTCALKLKCIMYMRLEAEEY